MKIEFAAPGDPLQSGETLALPAFEKIGLAPAVQDLDGALSGKVADMMAAARFKARLGDTLSFLTPPNLKVDAVLVVGAGSQDGWNARRAELLAAHAYKAAKASDVGALAIDLRGHTPQIAAHAAFGLRLASYSFDKYRTDKTAPALQAARIVVEAPNRAAQAFERLCGLADAICFARDLVSEPANVLFPAEFARRVSGLSRLGLEIEVLGETEMQALGMGALLGVGQGSRRESQLAVLQWRGAKDPDAPPVAFVGKGVCFDTGGISIKGADRMEEMIIDMSGAAAVSGAMYALAARKARVNAVGILGLVENMPDGNAQRPGDIVKTLSGQTVEIINTDAEGRMVLADALWYCQDRFKPRILIDLATLTGAIMTALGGDIGGLFSNDEQLAGNLLAASAATDERLWRLPLPDDYAKALESRAADVKHVGDRFGGAITAALFLQRFVGDTPWAHLDVGMTVWKSKSTSPISPDGATGYGVRLLDRLVADFYEEGAGPQGA